MTLSLSTKNAFRLALIATATISMAACASRPKPAGPAATSEAPPPPMDDGANRPPAPGPVGSNILPGSEQDFATNAGDRVYFDLDRYDVRSDAASTLDAQAAWLSRYPQVTVRVEGNADERGTREYNIALGARRASAVREYLSTHGVSPSRMATISYGKERPIAGGSDEESYQQNRNAHTAIVSGAR